MEFRLLGPVEAVIDGEPVVIAAPRQKIALALLLLEAGRVITVSRFIDALWTDNPPRTARSQVQITISGLRRLLGEQVIVTSPPGYMIRILEESFDLAQFDALRERAHTAVAQERPAEAVTLLRSALALWRGHAVDGVDSEVIQAAATRLNEQRIAAWQDCFDLELHLGRHGSVIGELSELVAEHPLNERFRAQLILALYRAGRQADALETFRISRQTLQAELGLDPGEELCRLEQAILNRDPQLDAPASAALSGAPGSVADLPIPQQLPRTIADFSGRDDTLQLISRYLTGQEPQDCPDVQVIVLTGRGGVGKTTLAVRAGHLLRETFPDGQLFLRLNTDAPQSVSGLLENVLRAAGIHPDVIPRDLEGRSAMYRSWLADRKVLVVIDDATNVSQLMHLLPGTRGSAAIVTSNQRFSSLEGALQIAVEPLDDESAHRLLARLIGDERASAEEEAAGDLIRLCDGLPLALRIVAAKLAARPHWRISRMIHLLVDEGRRLDELDLDGVSVRTTLSIAYDSLDADSRRLFRRLSLFGPDDFPPWVGGPLLDIDVDESEDLLHQLVQSNLIETRVGEDSTVRFYLHALVRIFAVECLASEESTQERLRSVRRLLGAWLFVTTAAHRLIYGGDFGVLHGAAQHWPLPPHTIEALLEDPGEWFRKERPALMSAIQFACRLGLDELCWDLAVTSATLFESGHYSDDWRDSHESALAVVRCAHNKRGEAALLCSLGSLEVGVCLAKARDYFSAALEIFELNSDDQGSALALAGLAFADRLDGRYDKALQTYHKAVAGFRVAGDRAGEAYTLKTMARIHADWQDFETAEGLLDTSLGICRELGSVRLTAQAHYELAELNLRRGRLADAIDAFEPVLRWTTETGDIIGQAYALGGLGNARRRVGDYAGAESALKAALELTERGDDRLVRGRTLLALAELDYETDQPELALARAREANKVLDELGLAGVWQARTFELLGRLHQRAGRTDAARQAWSSAASLVADADPALAGRLARELARLRQPG